MRLWTAQCPIPQTKHTLVSVIMDEIAGRNIKLCLVQTSVCWHSFMCDSTDNQPTTDHHQRSKLTIKRYLLPLSFWPFMQCSLTEFRWCILLNNCTPAACIGYLYLSTDTVSGASTLNPNELIRPSFMYTTVHAISRSCGTSEVKTNY